jgi:hypothetical protein
MPGKRETNHTGSSVLKTTTWGALIALTAATLVAGLLGHRQWTHSGDLGRPTAQVTEQSLPVAHSAVPAQRASSHSFASNPALFAHDNSSPAATQEARASLRPAGAVGNPLKWNPANFAHSSASSNDAATSLASASLSASEQQAVIAAKIAPDLKGVNPEAPIDVIVQFKTAAGASEVAADGATAKAELPLVHAQLVTVQGSSLARLAAHDSVAYISPNRKLLGAMDPVVTAVNADIASSQGWDGTGVGVAVIDSGVGTVDDLNSDGNSSPSRVVYSQSFVPGDSSTTDAYGHGTHVRYRRWNATIPPAYRTTRTCIAASRQKPISLACAYWTAQAPVSTVR